MQHARTDPLKSVLFWVRGRFIPSGVYRAYSMLEAFIWILIKLYGWTTFWFFFSSSRNYFQLHKNLYHPIYSKVPEIAKFSVKMIPLLFRLQPKKCRDRFLIKLLDFQQKSRLWVFENRWWFVSTQWDNNLNKVYLTLKTCTLNYAFNSLCSQR